MDLEICESYKVFLKFREIHIMFSFNSTISSILLHLSYETMYSKTGLSKICGIQPLKSLK